MGKIVRFEPLVPIREAVAASVQQARTKDAADLAETIYDGSNAIYLAASAMLRSHAEAQGRPSDHIAYARAAARRVIAACDEYERVAAACDPEMLTD